MDDSIDYAVIARDAVSEMQRNSKRVAHYYDFNGSPMRLLVEILKLPEVVTARLEAYKFNYFSITIELNSTNC